MYGSMFCLNLGTAQCYYNPAYNSEVKCSVGKGVKTRLYGKSLYE